MADECTDISTVEELSVYCRWVEDGVPVEHFLEILPLKMTDAGAYPGFADGGFQTKIYDHAHNYVKLRPYLHVVWFAGCCMCAVAYWIVVFLLD